jgi:hypothetical protein
MMKDDRSNRDEAHMYDEEAETEDDEGMDENGQSECPFCGSDDECPHLFASIDNSFGEWQGGYAFDRSDEFHTTVLKAFEARCRRGAGPHRSWAADELGEMWSYAVAHYEEGELMELDNDVLLRLLSDIFQEAGAMEIEEMGDDDAPGNTSAVSNFYAEDPAAVFNESLRRLNQRLDR